MEQPRIKIAVQKSGRLTDHCMELLTRCGLSYSRGRDQLICYGENMPMDVILVRDDDIPGLVQEDVCDLGIVGMNVLEEARLELQSQGAKQLFDQLRVLDFGHCRLSFGVPVDEPFEGPKSLTNKRIATSYPRIVGEYLDRHGISGSVVTFSGAVELAPRLGKADLICDLVSSGATLQAHSLYEADTILESRAAIIQTPIDVCPEKESGFKASARVEVFSVRETSTSCSMRASALERFATAARSRRPPHSAGGSRRQGAVTRAGKTSLRRWRI